MVKEASVEMVYKMDGFKVKLIIVRIFTWIPLKVFEMFLAFYQQLFKHAGVL